MCRFTNLSILNSTFLHYTPIRKHYLPLVSGIWILQILDVFVHTHVHVLHKWMTGIAVIFLNLRHWMHFWSITHTHTHSHEHPHSIKQQHHWKQLTKKGCYKWSQRESESRQVQDSEEKKNHSKVDQNHEHSRICETWIFLNKKNHVILFLQKQSYCVK